MRNIQSLNWRQLVEQLLNDPIFYDTMFLIVLSLHFPDNCEEWTNYEQLWKGIRKILCTYFNKIYRIRQFNSQTQ